RNWKGLRRAPWSSDRNDDITNTFIAGVEPCAAIARPKPSIAPGMRRSVTSAWIGTWASITPSASWALAASSTWNPASQVLADRHAHQHVVVDNQDGRGWRGDCGIARRVGGRHVPPLKTDQASDAPAVQYDSRGA